MDGVRKVCEMSCVWILNTPYNYRLVVLSIMLFAYWDGVFEDISLYSSCVEKEEVAMRESPEGGPSGPDY